MSSELAPRPAAPRLKYKQLAQRAVRAADKASKYLAEQGVDALTERMSRSGSEEMSNKDFIAGLSYLERISLQRAQVAKAAGLVKNGAGSTGPQTVVNIQLRGDLPLEERLRLIQAEVSAIPMTPAVLNLPVTPSETREAVSPVEGPGSDPEPRVVSEVVPEEIVAPTPPGTAPAELPSSLEDRLADYDG